MADEKTKGAKPALRLKRKGASAGGKAAADAKKEATSTPADAAVGEPAVPSGRLSGSAKPAAPVAAPVPDAPTGGVAPLSPGLYGAEGDPWVYEVRPDGTVSVRNTTSGKAGTYKPGSEGHSAIQAAIQGKPAEGVSPLTLGGGAAGRKAASAPSQPAAEVPVSSPAELPGESPVDGEPAPDLGASEQPDLGTSEQPAPPALGATAPGAGLTDDRIRAAVKESAPTVWDDSLVVQGAKFAAKPVTDQVTAATETARDLQSRVAPPMPTRTAVQRANAAALDAVAPDDETVARVVAMVLKQLPGMRGGGESARE